MPDDDSDVGVSERETQFVPRSDDDKVLWTVEEITAERGNKYRVRWAGTDPATGKPWTQSWVAKHDCTDDLVADWKRKKKRGAERKRGGRKSTTSRSSVNRSSVRTGSSTSGRRTRASASAEALSRLNSVEEEPLPVPAPKPSRPGTKRKRESEVPVMARTTTTAKSAAQQEGEEEKEEKEEKEKERGESPRPHKRQRTALEWLIIPPLSSSESDDGVALLLAEARTPQLARTLVSPERNGPAVEGSEDEDDRSPPKPKGKDEAKATHRADVHPRGASGRPKSVDVRGTSGMPHSATAVSRREEPVADSDASEDEECQPLKHESPPEQHNYPSEQEKVDASSPIKVGPPRGVKRRGMLRGSGSARNRGPPRTKPRENGLTDEVLVNETRGHAADEVTPSGVVVSTKQHVADSPASFSPPRHISIPPSPVERPRSPELSPWARARLELFDRMMADAPQLSTLPLPAAVFEHMPDDSHFNIDDNHDTTYDTYDNVDLPHPQSPSPTKSKSKTSKLDMQNGLVVPETESSGNLQSQPRSMLESPSPLPRGQPSHKPVDLPTIAITAASVPGSSTSPQDPLPPPQRPSFTNLPLKKPAVRPAQTALHSRIHRMTPMPEAPPSSIESFTSPNRVHKGKERAVDVDEVIENSLSEREGANERRQEPAPTKKITDSELKRRGRELFDQAQLVREAARSKTKKTTRLKSVGELVNGMASTSTSVQKGSSSRTPLDLKWGEVIDLTGGANSTTLDTQERSEVRPLSREERERLRIELRQEEEESTQEAMGIYPSPPPVNVSNVVDPMPPPGSLKDAPFKGHVEDVEQPSGDLQLASVIVQASQEQGHEDMDTDLSPANHRTSSPPRPIPGNLTDSPRRRLGEALSLLNLKSEEIQRLERELTDARENIRGLKAELVEARTSSEPTPPVRAAWDAERAQWHQERSQWKDDRSAWEVKQKDILDGRASLEARLAELEGVATRAEEATARMSELEVKPAAWTEEREALRNDLAQRSEEVAALIKVREEQDQDQPKRAQWVAEKAIWETERAAVQEAQAILTRSVEELTASVQSLIAAKASAETDRDFFREQYMQASGFVSTVRAENMELENRTKIAEGQAQEGVAAIKTLFEGRIKALQADLDRWKSLTELLQEKDKRTNDTLRLRAAQAPELDELCGRLSAEKRSLEADLRKLGQAQQRSIVQRHKLYGHILALQRERAALKTKLAALARLASGGSTTQDMAAATMEKPAVPTSPSVGGVDPNDVMLPNLTPLPPDSSFDDPTLFPCMWRPQWRDQCQQVFDTKEDLERHVHDHYHDLLAE